MCLKFSCFTLSFWASWTSLATISWVLGLEYTLDKPQTLCIWPSGYGELRGIYGLIVSDKCFKRLKRNNPSGTYAETLTSSGKAGAYLLSKSPLNPKSKTVTS